MKEKNPIETLEERLAKMKASFNEDAVDNFIPQEQLPPMPGQKRTSYDFVNLTRDQFFWLAQHRPTLDIPSVYELNADFIRSEQKGYHRIDELGGDWGYELVRFPSISYYSCSEKAEEAIKKMPETEDSALIHSFLLKRYALDGEFVSQEIDWWLYDSEGRMIDKSVCSALHENDYMFLLGRFLGRSPELMRFKRGDIVEVIRDNHCTLAIVTDKVRSIEEMWMHYQDSQARFGKDIKDYLQRPFLPGCMADHYYVTDIKGNDIDVFPEYLMKPRFEVPEEARKALETSLNKWLDSINPENKEQ